MTQLNWLTVFVVDRATWLTGHVLLVLHDELSELVFVDLKHVFFIFFTVWLDFLIVVL